MTTGLFERREVMSRALFLLGAAAVTSASPKALAKTAKSGSRYLDTATFMTLSAIADTIVPRTTTPGAVDVRVPSLLDGMLQTWASGPRRFELAQAILEIDKLALAQTSTGFAQLTPDQRHDLLSKHDVNSLRQVADTRKLSGMAALIAGPSIANPGYGKLRELIILLYYYSEPALTTELSYEHVPGGWTPSIKVTPETRAPGGLGMF